MFKELSPQDWFDEITDGLEFRRLYGLENSWNELEGMFYNATPIMTEEGPNIISSTGDSVLSQLGVPFPYVMVKARTKANVFAARILESVDNGLMSDINLSSEIENAVLHAFLWGTGILKIGYDSEWGWDQEWDDWKGIGNLGLTVSQFDKKGRRIEFNSRVSPGMPWVKACLPHDIVVPFGVRSLEEAPWVAHRIVRHVDDIKADVKYSSKRDLQPVISMHDYMKSYESVKKPYRIGTDFKREGTILGTSTMGSKNGIAEFCELFEIHDRRTGKVIVVATGHDKFLRKDTDLLQVNGLPFVDFSLTPRARSFWTTSDAYYLKSAQAELSDISLQATKQRRLGILKFLFAEEGLNEEELEKMLSSEVGAAAKVNSGTNLREAVLPITPSNQNIMLQQDAEYVRRNARESVGLSRNQLGEFESSGRRTATEASVVQAASSERTGRREKVIRGVYSSLIRKINGVIFDYWTSPRWANVLGDAGNQQWVAFRGTELKGDFSYDVILTQDPQSLLDRRQGALGMFSAMAGNPMVDPSQLMALMENAFNDPELKGVFRNANISGQMSQVSAQGGGVPQGNTGGVSRGQVPGGRGGAGPRSVAG